MTDATDSLDLRAEIARIDRDRAETQKLGEEGRKYIAESLKYAAETRRMDREYRYFPWLQLFSSGAIAALVAALIAHWR